MQEAQNLEILPRLYEQQEMDRLFPMLDASLAGPNVEDWDCDDVHEKLQKGQEKSQRGVSRSAHGELPEDGCLVAFRVDAFCFVFGFW